MMILGKWMELGSVTLSETGQFHKDQHHLFPLTCGI